MQEIKQTIVQQSEKEITLKELVLKLKDWRTYLLSKWWVIGIMGVVGAGLGLTYALLESTKYVAKLTFVLEDSGSGSPLAAYAGLASQFGIDLGGASSSGVFQGDNILEFLKSRLMIEKTLLSPIKVNNNKEQSLADLYIEIYHLDESWEKRPNLKGIHFPFNLDRSKFSLEQDSLLNMIQKRIVKTNLKITKPDKKLNFISVTCTTPDQIFSKSFTERLVKEATDFYVNTKIKRSQVNVNKLQSATDSLEILLNRKTYSLAAAKDLNQNPAREVANVKSEVQARDKMVLQTMYAEVVKNLELSKMAMAQEIPIVQVVDTPILPLERDRLGKVKGILLGGFLGGFFATIWLIMRNLYKQIMA